MPATGINLTLRIGAKKPRAAPRLLTEALQSVEVTHSDRGRSGFQMVFEVGRAGRRDLRDYQLLKNPLLTPFNRVILIVTMSASAQVLMDGIITNQQLSPSLEPGKSTFTITGEDVSVMMDLDEKSVEHPQQNPKIIVESLISDYKSPYGLKAEVSDPYDINRPGKNERIPVQQGTDLSYINELAKRYGYIFYVRPDSRAEKNIAYWGPQKRGQGTPIQRALSVNMSSFNNVDSLNFQHNALAATTVLGQLQDRKTNKIEAINQVSRGSKARPELANKTPLPSGSGGKSQPRTRVTQFRETGLVIDRAEDRAQGTVDRSTDEVVSISGTLVLSSFVSTVVRQNRLYPTPGLESWDNL